MFVEEGQEAFGSLYLSFQPGSRLRKTHYLPTSSLELAAAFRPHNSFRPKVFYKSRHFVTVICCFDMGKMCGK